MKSGRKFPTPASLLVVCVACASTGSGGSVSRPDGTTLSDLVTAEYDPLSDSTRVRTVPMPVAGTLELYAGYRHAGRDATAPIEMVSFIFQETSAAPRWQRPRGRDLVLKIGDSTVVDVERTLYLREVVEGRGPVTLKVVEWVWADLPVETFRVIANAVLLDGRIGSTSFQVEREDLAVFRELVRRLPAPTDSAATTP